MKTKKLLFYLLAGLLAGCVPVMSLHPLYDKDKENVIFKQELLGTWVANETTWQFKDVNESEKAYELIFSDDEGKKGLFAAHLVKLQNQFFLDVYPDKSPCKEQDLEKVEWSYNVFFLVPVHTFIKIDSIGPPLKMRLTDDEAMEKLLKENPNAVEHTSIDNQPVLTASTKELQAFVLEYADDSRVFTDEFVLSRKKNKAPQKSGKQETNEPADIDPQRKPKS